MSNYFEVKIKLDRVNTRGITKKCTENYLVIASSFTEAESRIIKIIGENKDCDVVAIKKSKYQDYIDRSITEEDTKWFQIKTMYVAEEDNGTEYTVSEYHLLKSTNVQQATKDYLEHIKSFSGECTINSVIETRILDIV